jgi:hypothetical protein
MEGASGGQLQIMEQPEVLPSNKAVDFTYLVDQTSSSWDAQSTTLVFKN